ncbi:MAG: hypothetical protein JO025_11400, partial [Verrucomicrobia bacterium]|nr:hypothetical protein [Verrucomicrobiota bacterium]
KASKLDVALRNGRQGTLRVYGSLEASKEEIVNGLSDKVLYIKATRVVLSVGPANQFAGEKTIGQ